MLIKTLRSLLLVQCVYSHVITDFGAINQKDNSEAAERTNAATFLKAL